MAQETHRRSAAKPAPPEPPPAPARPALRPHVWRILGLGAVALLAYSNSFPAGMTLDNATVIVQDSRIQAATLPNVRLIFSQEYWYGNATTNLYRPLTTLSYLFNYAILGNGPHPAGYHWVNFALHAVNILLVYLLGLLIFRRADLALALAGVWGLHPALTESVTNIVGRADELAAFGMLAALLCSRPERRRQRSAKGGVAGRHRHRRLYRDLLQGERHRGFGHPSSIRLHFRARHAAEVARVRLRRSVAGRGGVLLLPRRHAGNQSYRRRAIRR